MNHSAYQVWISLGETITGKNLSLLHCKGRGIGWLCPAPQAVCPTILMKRLGDSWMSSMKLSHTKRCGSSSHLVHSWHGPWPLLWGIYACQGYTLKGCSVANPNSSAPIVKPESHMDTESKHHNRCKYMTYESVGTQYTHIHRLISTVGQQSLHQGKTVFSTPLHIGPK